jgi:hypothetical protein
MSIINELDTWIETFLNVPNDEFGGMPICPFANPARKNGAIRYTVLKPNQDLVSLLNTIGDNWQDVDKDGKVEIHVVLIEDTELYTAKLFAHISDCFNNKFMGLNLVGLDDHPDIPESVNGVNLNFGKAALFLISRLDVLNNASKRLQKTSYYDKWPEDYFDWVLQWRFTNRQHQNHTK